MQVPRPVQRTLIIYIVLMIVLISGTQVDNVSGQNTTVPGDDVCGVGDVGPWSALLEEWATTAPKNSDRHGRIMALPAANGYYVTERIDGPFGPPPPPPGHHMHPPGHHQPPPGHHGPPPGPHGPPHHPPGPPPKGHMPQSYNEWEASPPTAGGKIVNRPPNPYKDKFKPSYPPPSPGQQPARPQRPAGGASGGGGAPGSGAADRVDEPPRKQVTETDLYLLGAIEKLVYRVDLMEKRLRKMEESLHYIVAGTETKPEPCEGNFSRVGAECYWVSREAADWKGASLACRRAGASLIEPHDHNQRRVLFAKLLSDRDLQGSDFWTGGLNPGLLWIWSHSARPVSGNSTTDVTVTGDGRCLSLVHEPALRTYTFRGRDCALQQRYICQRRRDEAKLSNDIEKAARSLKLDHARKAKVLFDDV